MAFVRILARQAARETYSNFLKNRD